MWFELYLRQFFEGEPVKFCHFWTFDAGQNSVCCVGVEVLFYRTSKFVVFCVIVCEFSCPTLLCVLDKQTMTKLLKSIRIRFQHTIIVIASPLSCVYWTVLVDVHCRVTFFISTWVNDADTHSTRMFGSLQQTLDEMKTLLDSSAASMHKMWNQRGPMAMSFQEITGLWPVSRNCCFVFSTSASNTVRNHEKYFSAAIYTVPIEL